MPLGRTNRRAFIAALGGAAFVWPIATQAQQSRIRRVGVLLPFDEGDPQVQKLWPSFRQRIHDLGWTEDRNIRFDVKFAGQNTEHIRVAAEELVAAAPNVIYAWSNPAVAMLWQAAQHPHCVCPGFGPAWERLRIQLGASQRQHHWVAGVPNENSHVARQSRCFVLER
jgi:ABC-type uncharacterized transport system substrate-binding protein